MCHCFFCNRLYAGCVKLTSAWIQATKVSITTLHCNSIISVIHLTCQWFYCRGWCIWCICNVCNLEYFPITIYSQPHLHLFLTMVSIRTIEVKEGPQTYGCPSLFCSHVWAGLMRQTAAPVVEMSLWWTVPGRDNVTFKFRHITVLMETKADV